VADPFSTTHKQHIIRIKRSDRPEKVYRLLVNPKIDLQVNIKYLTRIQDVVRIKYSLDLPHQI